MNYIFLILSTVGTYVAEFERENILARVVTKATPIFLLAYEQPTNNLIKIGLILSGIGDILLIPFDTIPYGPALGVVAFTMAQIIYIVSFGFEKMQVRPRLKTTLSCLTNHFSFIQYQ